MKKQNTAHKPLANLKGTAANWTGSSIELPSSEKQFPSISPAPDFEKLAFTINQVCATTGVGRTSVYEDIRAGKLKSVMVAGRRLVRRTDLENWLKGEAA